MKQLFYYSLFLLLTSSCIITNTPGFYSGYKKLSVDEKKQILFIGQNLSVCNLKNDGKIVAIFSSNLLNCIKGKDTSVIYFWSPNCHSRVCISLESCQNYCTSKGYKLFVIADYYDFAIMQAQNNLHNPIFIVNNKVYHTDYCNKYMKLFKKDLLGHTPSKENELYTRFYFFTKGKFIYCKNELYEDEKYKIKG